MADYNEKNTGEKNIDVVTEHTNALTFDDRVIKKIAGIAASEIPGILAISGNFISGIADKLRIADDPTKGITVEVGKKQTAIDMKVICEYGRNVPQIFQSIVDKVSEAIKEMTGLEVIKVNVHVYDILTKEDFERQSKKKAEELLVASAEEAIEAPPARVE